MQLIAENLILSRAGRVIVADLSFRLQDGEALVLTGRNGSGKTTLIRRALQILDPQFRVGIISNTHRNIGELLKWVLFAFDLDYHSKDKAELYHIFIEFIIQQYASNRRTLLIIDEAQNMDVETLEELRMLTNVNTDKDQILQLLLVGQPELAEKLKRPELRQFRQRISAEDLPFLRNVAADFDLRAPGAGLAAGDLFHADGYALVLAVELVDGARHHPARPHQPL